MRKEDAKTNVKGHKDYEYFLRDLEDDPELRANVNLYKDDDIMAELEAKVAKMGIHDEETSNYKKELNKGEVNVGGQKRIVKSAVRKTAIGKARAHQEEKARLHSEAVFKASLKTKEDVDDASSWESVEEDAPAIKLEELLSNMRIADEEEDEAEEEKEES